MTHRLALLGGPESGKSTYLGALIDAFESGTSGSLSLAYTSTDTRPLERLTEPLLEGHYPQRTKGERFSLDLALTYHPPEGHPQDVELSVGDYDGEEVERLFRERGDGWSPEWRVRAESSALLLLLRPDAIIPLPLLQRISRVEPPTPRPKARFGEDPSTVFEPGITANEVPPRRAAAPDEPLRIPIPTVLTLIELLQFIRKTRDLAPAERPTPGTLRIGVILSAWDAVDPIWQSRSPADYASQHVHLLVDFLWSNFHTDDVMYFGLSSTGGNLADPRYQQRYMENPGGFVAWSDVSGDVQQSNDLALPIRWALFGDGAMRHDP